MKLASVIGALVVWNQVAMALTAIPYQAYTKTLLTYYGCDYQIELTATFCPEEEEESCYCSNWAALATFAGCTHYMDRTTPDLLKHVTDLCAGYNYTVTAEQYEEAYTNYTLYAKNVTEIPGFNATEIIDYPVLLDDHTSWLFDVCYKEWLGNYNNSLYYGAGILGYWLVIFLFAAIANWTVVLFPNTVKTFVGPVSNAWRKHITAPALVRKKKANPQSFLYFFDFLIPSRLETLIIFGFVVITTGLNACTMRYIEGDPIFITKTLTLSRYVADRTGVTVSVFIPLLILVGGRNNFLQWFTRWNFATFITFHKWIGRVVFVLVFIHSVAFSIALADDWLPEMRETYMIWGTIATVSNGLILGQGFFYLRRRWYEMFIFVHIVLAALFIAGSWLHVMTLGYADFYYAASAVWILDTIVRIARLAAFGTPKAEVILLADETLKVIVPRPSYWKPIPGGYAFVHFLRPSCFWQSHPFTFTETEETKDKIILYLKVKGGMTHGLYQYLSTHPGKTANIRVSIEGPYGQPSPAKGYDSAVFIAGGNGIPGIYSEIYDLALRSPDNTKQDLKLLWIVREYRSLYWFYEELLALKKVRVKTTVYITRPDKSAHLSDFNHRIPLVLNEIDVATSAEGEKEVETKNIDTEYSTKEKNNSIEEFDDDEQLTLQKVISTIKKELPHITFIEGRPTMEELVKSETKASSGSTAFVACGHPLMVDDLRASVVENIDNAEGKRIDFYEQLQVWA